MRIEQAPFSPADLLSEMPAIGSPQAQAQDGPGPVYFERSPEKPIAVRKAASAAAVCPKKKPAACAGFFHSLAERVGFEPTVPCGTPDFESGTFDHSATSPEPGCIQLGWSMRSRAF
jgi:hypothetical protein